ncbi:protein IWS1 homolog isoform X2 [Ostrea edulis]|nr:protein IWS1 homolog isoform X2 [Ostrea edulis]
MGGNRYLTKTPPPDDNVSSKLDESWPSSERPSSVSLTGRDDRSPYALHKMLGLYGRKEDYSDVKQTLSFTETDPKGPTEEDPSTLQRYIERFRRSEPMSREERQRQTAASAKDFWWIDPSLAQNEQKKKSSVRKVAENSPPDEITQRLQDRAERLLERSVSTVSSTDPIVSTDGLGSSCDGTLSSFEEQPYRPAFAKNFDTGPSRPQYPSLNQEVASYPRPTNNVPVFPRATKPARPEDDILHQWRVKRRLESARDMADKVPASRNTFGFLSKQPDQAEMEAKLSEFKERLSGKRTSTENQRNLGAIQFTPVPNQNFTADQNSEYLSKFDQRKTDIIPPVASPSLGKPGKQTGVEPHLHLMCDLLPCQHSKQYQDRMSKSHTTEKAAQQKTRTEGQSSKTVDDKIKEDSEFDVGETKMGKYKYLQAERPDVEKNKPSNEESGSESETSKNSSHSNKQKPNRKNDRKSPSVVSDVKDSGEVRSQGVCHTTSEEEVPRQRNLKLSREVRKSGSNLTKSEDENFRSKNLKHSREIRSQGRDHTESDDNVPRPRGCHSPSMKKFESVNSAIGQVIKDRLFVSSLSSVMDSVDSNIFDQDRQSVDFTESTRISHPDNSQQLGLLPPDPKPPTGLSDPDSSVKEKQAVGMRKEKSVKDMSSAPDQGTADRVKHVAAVQNGEGYESDGEFPDDQLLQILRSQRLHYEEQLGHIDKLLTELSPLS